MSSEKFDQASLDTMTPEERAAIEDEEFSPEELAAMKGIAGDDEGDDDEGADESSAAPIEQPAAATAEKPAAATTPEVPAADTAEPVADDKDDTFVPRYQAKLPEDYDAQVAALKDETRELAKKFKDGDLDIDDYQAGLDALNERRDALSEVRIKASISEDMSAQTMEQQWQSSILRFTKAVARDEKIDYSKDLEKQADLDNFVKVLAANPKNADKDFDWYLTEAHKRVKALHGIAATAETPKVEDPKPKAKPTRTTPAAPSTLAQVPGGDGPGDVGGEFADLDSLEGMELETAIAKMTPSQRERYVRGE